MESTARVILHLDMDAFYASVEQRDQPGLRGKPVIVGAPPGQRGVVCAASYEARRFGVRSAMASSTAGRLCPSGVFLRPRMEHYREESRKIFELVGRWGAPIEQVSVDEAYVELTGLVGGGDVEERLLRALPMARGLRGAIWEGRRLTASVGIASNKLLAKLASDFKKPDGLTLIPHRDRKAFLAPMAVGVLHGVGRVTEEALGRVGVKTVGDLQEYTGDLRGVVGSFGGVLKRFAVGDDDRPLELGGEAQSISSETTFLQDTLERPILRRSLWEQAVEIAEKLRGRGMEARTVQVKVRYGDFQTLTRQVSLEEPVMEAREIYRMGCWLLGRDRLVSRPLRLLGLGVSGLGGWGGRGRQLHLPFRVGS